MQSRQPNSSATPIRNRLHLPFGQRKVSVRYICKTTQRNACGWKTGLPVTGKSDKANHGFGIRSMQLLAEKYGGELTFRQEGDIVNTYILLPLAPAET